MMYDSFNVLLDLDCRYFVEDFCSFVHQGCVCSVAEFCPTLCDPMDCSSSGSTVHRISQARMLEWVSVSYSRGPSWPESPVAPALAGEFFTTVPPGEPSPRILAWIFNGDHCWFWCQRDAVFMRRVWRVFFLFRFWGEFGKGWY